MLILFDIGINHALFNFSAELITKKTLKYTII